MLTTLHTDRRALRALAFSGLAMLLSVSAACSGSEDGLPGSEAVTTTAATAPAEPTSRPATTATVQDGTVATGAPAGTTTPGLHFSCLHLHFSCQHVEH